MTQQNNPSPRFTRFVLGLSAAAVAALLLFMWTQSGGQKQAEAHFPHPGIDFSISAGLLTKGAPPSTPTPTPTPIAGAQQCDSDLTGGLPAKCTFALGAQFRLYFWLRTIPSGFLYTGYDANVSYSAGLTVNQSSMALTGSGTWPGCFFAIPSFSPGFVQPACSINVNAAASSYTGVMWYISFTCNSTNSIENISIIHGAGNTDISDNSSVVHGELASGTEGITINCGNPPTPTFTPTFTRTPTLTPTVTFTPTITNTPTITPTPTQTPTPSNTPTQTPLPSNEPDVTITKTDSPDPVNSGGTITYSLLVKNIGQATATGVQAVDLLPPEVTFVSASSPGANCTYDSGTNAVTCNLKAPLAFNGAVKITVLVTAPSPDHDIRVTNIAAVAATNEPVFNQGNKADFEQTVVLAPRSDVTLDVTDSPDPVNSEGKLVYTLTAINLGPQKATNVIIKDRLPDGAVFKPAGSSPECLPPLGGPILNDPDIGRVDVICTVGSLVDQATFHISVNMARTKRDANVYSLAYIQADNERFSDTGNNIKFTDTIVLAPPPDVAVQVSAPPKVRRVQKYSYTLTITNVGIGDAFNVVVSAMLSPYSFSNKTTGVTLQQTGGATCPAPTGNKLTCVIDKLAGNNGQVVITLNVRAPTVVQDVKVTNQVTASLTSQPDANPSNNQASASTTVQACFDVTGDGVVKIDDVIRVINAYGSHQGDSRYNVLYDFDGDGYVRLYDVIAVIDHYRQVCS